MFTANFCEILSSIQSTQILQHTKSLYSRSLTIPPKRVVKKRYTWLKRKKNGGAIRPEHTAEEKVSKKSLKVMMTSKENIYKKATVKRSFNRTPKDTRVI